MGKILVVTLTEYLNNSANFKVFLKFVELFVNTWKGSKSSSYFFIYFMICTALFHVNGQSALQDKNLVNNTD